MISFRAVLVGLCLAVPATALAAQGTQVDMGMKANPSAPVEVTSDQLQVNQKDGTALFTGNVIATQDQMKLTADKVHVDYVKGENGQKGKIKTIHAMGNVVMVTSPTEAAKGADAVYTLESGHVVMTGNVLLTQGQNVMSGTRLVVNLHTGLGTMTGRVKTTLLPQTAPGSGGKSGGAAKK
ncbi:lipopolysaccharide transport periplasmic protein LptA [Acidimangrovimonas sediminis]|uniref:lipopolysaccharide transport periplasmic protein LptA n=1 Tax=Acidimangrovimonas sediminis TaxID=2056283 RepID=UPI001E310A2E|nr:lipopolysaccharide transport periplasmic protein LptA [Acidimangrovimonas sediminis]